MDRRYPLFSNNISVRKLIARGIKKNRLSISPDEVRTLFGIDENRFERSLSFVGNEIFKVMTAIGYCYGKQVFCFPWPSQKRFTNYRGNMTYVLDTLASLNKIVILPIGEYSNTETSSFEI